MVGMEKFAEINGITYVLKNLQEQARTGARRHAATGSGVGGGGGGGGASTSTAGGKVPTLYSRVMPWWSWSRSSMQGKSCERLWNSCQAGVSRTFLRSYALACWPCTPLLTVSSVLRFP